MKSEEKSIQAISAQAHSEAADNRLLRKKLQARDKRVVELEAMVSNLNKQLCEKVDQLNDMMQKLVAFMTGNGEINLSDSLREAVVAGVRAEFEAREQKLKETYASELEKLTSDFNARLAAKQNEINQLKGMGLNYGHPTVMGWIEIGANILEPLDDPLQKEIIASGNVHGDESTLGCKDQRLPGKGETIEDVEEEPELLKAVNYALTEYPCMLRCLEDGSLDLSNNVCERQIRRIAKYRNNSYFVGSPESGVRFARLMSHFANIRKHNLDPVEYLCDVFRRTKKTAKDKLVDLLAHRWQLATVTAWV